MNKIIELDNIQKATANKVCCTFTARELLIEKRIHTYEIDELVSIGFTAEEIIVWIKNK